MTATAGGISQIGENTNAWMDSDAASSRMNDSLVAMLVSMVRFSNQRSRRFGCSG